MALRELLRFSKGLEFWKEIMKDLSKESFGETLKKTSPRFCRGLPGGSQGMVFIDKIYGAPDA